MYGLDKSVDFQFLIGRELLQLCIGLHQIILNFSDDISISLECAVLLTNADGLTIEVTCNNPKQSQNLICLLGSTIESAVAKNEGELMLGFSQKCKLSITDSNEDTESYTITMPDHEIIV